MKNATKSEIGVEDRITFNDNFKNWLNNIIGKEKSRGCCNKKAMLHLKTKAFQMTLVGTSTMNPKFMK